MLTRRAALTGIAGTALIAGSSSKGAAPKGPYVYPASAALRAEDAAILIRAYEELHPGLTRYLIPEARAAAEARLRSEAAVADTPGALWLAATRFTAAVRCGHSFCNPFNQGKALTAALVERPDRLPFLFRWIDRRMIVTRGLGDATLRPGTEVLVIDGEPAPALLARLMRLARADGHNDAKRIADLEVRGAGKYEDFDVLRSLTARPGATTAMLEVRDPDGKHRRIEVPLLGFDSRPRADNKSDAPLFTAAMRGPAMVLTMPDWATYDSKWDWRGFIDKTVDDAIAANARAIVVDLRGNEGGEDCGDVLLGRLVDRRLGHAPALRRVRYRTTPADLDPHLDTWDDSFRKLGADAVDDKHDCLLTLPPEPSLSIVPRSPRFTGKLVVLVDAECSSATFQFAQTVRSAGRGTIVGEPTGGNRRGINGGAFFFLRLPNSRLEVDLPLIGSFPLVPQPDAGLVPDVLAAPTQASLAAGTDPGMAAALRLV
ncbi:S41 family peptidase [Sphingosinicellaceae bacterium]|nr:S41 family peptidase [Sphingosinicellaceae bacterium]